MSAKENTPLIINMGDSEEDKKESCIYSTWIWFLKQLLNFSWIYPPIICGVVGTQVSFKASLVAATAISYFFTLLSWILYKFTPEESDFHPGTFPRLFDVFNPIIFTILIPIGFAAGEEFCRVWIGVINLGCLCLIILGSIAVKKPWMIEFIDLPEDKRMHPMVWDTRYWMTGLFGTVFLIMFVSSLIVAIEDLKVGTAWIIFAFVIPYSALGLGITFGPFIGKWIWMKSAKKHYGEDWATILFPEETAEATKTKEKLISTTDVLTDSE